MKVKTDPVMEAIARKLFGIQNVPPMERERMIKRAVRAGAEALREERECSMNSIMGLIRAGDSILVGDGRWFRIICMECGKVIAAGNRTSLVIDLDFYDDSTVDSRRVTIFKITRPESVDQFRHDKMGEGLVVYDRAYEKNKEIKALIKSLPFSGGSEK